MTQFVRQKFLNHWAAKNFFNFKWVAKNAVHDIAKVYINGIQVDNNQFDPYQTKNVPSAHYIDEKLFKAGKNVIAIHCHQIDGDQEIDAGIIDVSYE